MLRGPTDVGAVREGTGGRVTLTDKPKHSGYKQLVKTWKGWEESKSRIALRDFEKNREKYTPTIDRIARQYRLPTAFVHAAVTAESAYDPEGVSRAGAVGLMQLMPDTARRYGVRNRRDPSQNVDGGIRYLRDLLHMFNNNAVLALAAYNAGENAVIRHGNQVPPYNETRTTSTRCSITTGSTASPDRPEPGSNRCC